jgi:hypothetical protein
MRITPDRRVVRARRDALHAAGQVAYWIVLSYQDGLDLLAHTVPAAVRAQVRTNIKRSRAESAEEYAARVAEADAIPAHVKTTRGGLVIE